MALLTAVSHQERIEGAGQDHRWPAAEPGLGVDFLPRPAVCAGPLVGGHYTDGLGPAQGQPRQGRWGPCRPPAALQALGHAQ